eukprot:comp6551_c0_seq1/m.2321 comp6551_c0_seq1/g.2321  ORF comp6551_c0_seq1/g.2321 comp6551_c0_seq1/m.2321 type:complete len:281 (-) comp6551_c0_seq1:571-1413(-)
MQVYTARGISSICFLLFLKHLHRFDSFLSTLWEYARTSPVFLHDSFEPLVVMFSFTVCAAFWFTLDRFVNPHTLAPYKLHRTTYHDLKGWYENRGTFFMTTFLWYYAPILALDYFFPRRLRRMPIDPPGALTVVSEVIGILFVYDLLFTVAHLAMHKVPGAFKLLHAHHHKHVHTHAYETFRLGLVEMWTDVFCSIIAVNSFGAHPLSRAFYNANICYLLTELHGGYNFPWMISNIIPGGFISGSLQHAEHHRTGTVYYQKFFAYLDWVMGYTKKVSKVE